MNARPIAAAAVLITLPIAVALIATGIGVGILTPPMSGGTLTAALLVLAGGSLAGRVLHVAARMNGEN